VNKVVITGAGVISPLGTDKKSSFLSALHGHSAIGPSPADIAERLPDVLVARIPTDPATLLDRQYAGLDRATQFALLAAHEAMTQSAMVTPAEDPRRIGVFVGIGFGGAQTVDHLYTRYFTMLADATQAHKNPSVMHPLSVPRMMANAAAAAISMRYGLHGPSNTYSVACASSATAIGEAFRAIRHGYLDAAVVVGAEAMLNLGALMAWNALRVMAKPDSVDASRSCRPFSLDRSGFILGEGAAALVLENETRSASRGADVLAEMAGYGCSSDAQHLTAPSAEGQAHAMQDALNEAGLAPGRVGYLNAHGTATKAGDVIETQAIHQVFGSHVSRLAVSSTKAVHGHLIGAGGALEFVLSIMAMNSGSLPPTAHLDTPDPQCDLDYVPLRARHNCDIEAVMSNSFAFGGSNVSLVARRPTP
jgi:3-oxoacyl-[acyl-carrier-protein] synthase II